MQATGPFIVLLGDCDYSYSNDGKKLILTGGEETDGGTYELDKVSKQTCKEDDNE